MARQRRLIPVLVSDARAEAAEAACSSLDHGEAAQLSAVLEKQYRQQWSRKMASAPVELNAVLRALTNKRIRFVLTGAHGIGGWTGKPRATHGIDILVRGGRDHARAVTTIKKLYPHLEARSFAGVTAFFVPGDKHSVIDITFPHRRDLEETLARPIWTADEALGLRYRIPALEAALANKYGAMMTATRNPLKRAQDAVDFAWMVAHSLDEGQTPIDLQRLAALGEKA